MKSESVTNLVHSNLEQTRTHIWQGYLCISVLHNEDPSDCYPPTTNCMGLRIVNYTCDTIPVITVRLHVVHIRQIYPIVAL